MSSNPTITISLTSFVDFVVKTGTTRITCVQDIKEQMEQEYDPATDYWKRLRDAIVEFHKASKTHQWLRRQVAQVTSPSKVANYQACLADYLRWVGRKSFTWFQFKCSNFTQGGLRVKVNPELQVEINGMPHLVKLYFKAGGPNKRAVDPILHLIEACSSGSGASLRPTPAVLDVRRRKLHIPTHSVRNIEALLRGEAAGFETMYRQLP